MKNSNATLLIELITDPKNAFSLNVEQWCGLVALSRQIGFLPFLYQSAVDIGILEELPQSVKSQLVSAQLELTKQHDSVIWHFEQLLERNPPSVKVALLKGAAYILGKKKNAKFRLISDIDLLVEKKSLAEAEFWLFLNGFAVSTSDEYDDYYYRQWMHELPPFVSAKSGLVVDLHHNILPISSKRHIDAKLLFENAKSIPPNCYLPCDEDLIIHAGVHLIQDSVFNRTLRDLCDQYWLLEDYVKPEKNTDKLLERAYMLGLNVDLAKNLELMQRILNRSLTHTEERFVRQNLRRLPTWPIERSCYLIMLRQPTLSQWSVKHRIASSYLFAKSHFIKMPIKLLVKHTLVKSYKRILNFYNKE